MKPSLCSNQGSTFNNKLCVYKGKICKTHSLLQLEYVVEQGQHRQPKQLSSHGNLQLQPRQMSLSRLIRPVMVNVQGMLSLLKTVKVKFMQRC